MRTNSQSLAETALAERLAQWRFAPDGTLEDIDSPLHHIRILKHGSQIHFYFVNVDGALDGPMSRIDLNAPAHLIAEYTQACLLVLLWQPEPQHVCSVGLAGGRIPLVLWLHFPHLVIDNIELDPAVGQVAEHYFGVIFDQRQRLIVADANAELRRDGQQYECLLLDAFRDSGDDLDELATTDFYRACKRRLKPGGVIAVNTLYSDPHYQQKVAAFASSMRSSYAVPLKHGAVVFGSDQPRLSTAELTRRARVLQQQHQFSFELPAHAAALVPLRDFLRSLS